MGQIRKLSYRYEYVSDRGIAYDIGDNGADFNIIIDSFVDYDEECDNFGPFNFHIVDYVMGELDDPETIEWIDKRIERYENHERVLEFYDCGPCECYVGFKEEKYETRKRVPKETLLRKKK